MAESGQATARRAAVARPPRLDMALMGVGVVAVSTSGPLMAAAAAPALAGRSQPSGVAVGARLRRPARRALRDLGAEPDLHLGRVGDRALVGLGIVVSARPPDVQPAIPAE